MSDLRKQADKLSVDAIKDDWVGLHEENAELRATVKALCQERDQAKAQLKEALAGDDMGRALGNALRQRDTVNGRLKEELTKNVRMGRRIAALEDEVKKLTAKLEAQEITL